MRFASSRDSIIETHGLANRMASSKSFRDLRARIRELRSHFLPKRFDDTGTYTKRQIDRVRAFRVLAHAEIEWYLEEIVVDTANKAFEAWKQHGRITKPLVAMVAYSNARLTAVPKSKSLRNAPTLACRIEKSRNELTRHGKSRNHGIREKNILGLLLPVGIGVSEIDPTWLSTTDSFGQVRGETAHLSNRVYHPPDPKNEFDIVSQVVEGLSKIDERLVELQS